MNPVAATGPCVASEPPASRLVRLAASGCALGAALLFASAAFVNLLGLRRDTSPAASVLFAGFAGGLVAACAAGFRVPRRSLVFLAGFASLLALGFTALGRGQSGLTFTTPHVTRYFQAAVPLVGCLAVVLLATQLAHWLARRHACSCG